MNCSFREAKSCLICTGRMHSRRLIFDWQHLPASSALPGWIRYRLTLPWYTGPHREAVEASIKANSPHRRSAAPILNALPLDRPVNLTTVLSERAALGKVRKGLYSVIAGARPAGTSQLLEDVAVPVEVLGETCRGLPGSSRNTPTTIRLSLAMPRTATCTSCSTNASMCNATWTGTSSSPRTWSIRGRLRPGHRSAGEGGVGVPVDSTGTDAMAYFRGKLRFEIDVMDVADALPSGEFLLVDTRRRASWNHGHILGAGHLPTRRSRPAPRSLSPPARPWSCTPGGRAVTAARSPLRRSPPSGTGCGR